MTPERAAKIEQKKEHRKQRQAIQAQLGAQLIERNKNQAVLHRNTGRVARSRRSKKQLRALAKSRVVTIIAKERKQAVIQQEIAARGDELARQQIQTFPEQPLSPIDTASDG